jgi:hypothetical protein
MKAISSVCKYLSFAVTITSLACASSSSLPDYAAPQGEVDRAPVDTSEMIAYRKLTREDFKAPAPPAEIGDLSKRVGAWTCVRTLSTPDTRVMTRETRFPNGKVSFEARIDELGFYALMDRKCSWWNDNMTEVPPSYVLEHEQIHFALHEIETRRLNASVPALQGQQFAGSSLQEVQRLANQAVEDAMRQTLDASLRINREFDEDTSLGYKPDRQKKWLARVTAQLATTAAHK